MDKTAVSSIILYLSLTLISGCANVEQKVFVKRVDFDVDPKANKGNPFVCNIVIPYSPDLVQKLHGMDAQMYFTQLPELKRLYKDKMEIFSYDIIPGKSQTKQKIEPRSRTSAFGAYIFAKYTVNGKFAERLGINKKIVVKFEEYKMTIYDGTKCDPQFDDKCAGGCPKRELPKTDHKYPKNSDKCIECPPGAEYAMVCDDGTTEFYPKKTKKNGTEKKEANCIECPSNVEYAEECDNGTIKYFGNNNAECVECPEGSEYLQECDDGSVIYLPKTTHVSKEFSQKNKVIGANKPNNNTMPTQKNVERSIVSSNKKSQSAKY